MSIKILYFDESGFTGYNLLDASQPIFSVASTDIDTDRAEHILHQSFPKNRASEYKFSNIWRTNNKIGLIEFGENLRKLKDHSFTWVVDKRFAVLTKIVDFLIEPYITDAGFNFYADGFCWKYANYIHYGLTQFGSPELYDSLVMAYQSFSRDPSRERLENLQTQLSIMAATLEAPIDVFFEQMALGASLFCNYHDLDSFKGSDELQVTSMIAVITHWRQHCDEDFSVVHDASSNFFRHRETWARVTNNKVPTQTVTLGDGTTVQFPLRVTSTHSVDSKDNYSVQFCDILAGLTTKHFDARIVGDNRILLDEIVAAGMGEIAFNGIRPGTVFPDQIPPKRLTGPDAVDQMMGILYGPHNGPE